MTKPVHTHEQEEIAAAEICAQLQGRLFEIAELLLARLNDGDGWRVDARRVAFIVGELCAKVQRGTCIVP
jgi:hypothetical protein